MADCIVCTLLVEVKMSGSESIPAANGVDAGNGKRTVTHTEKALEYKIEKLQKECKSKVNKLKSVITALKELMKNDDNVLQVQAQLENLMQILDDAISLHKSLMPVIPPEEQKRQSEWFTSINKYNQGFIDDVKLWLSETGIQTNRFVSSNGQMRNKNLERHAERGNLKNVELEEPHLHNKITPQLEQDALPGAIVDEIQPSDSVSNVSNKRHGSTSRTSTTSSTTSARVKAEAEMAALLARQKLLK